MTTNQPSPVEPAELTDQELLRTYNEELLQTYNARNYINEERVRAATIAGLRAVIAADRARRAALPAEGELVDLADAVMSWAARLDEGTPEERLLGRVSAVLRQRQAPPNEGEVDALIKILSRIARMLDFMPDGPPKGLIIHRAIELLRQLAPPAEGEVRELVRLLKDVSGDYDDDSDPPSLESQQILRAADLLQQQAAELAMLRQQVAPVAVSERLPDTSDPSKCRMPDGDCWWFDPHQDGAWYMDTYQSCYTHWLPAHVLPLPSCEAINA